MNIVVAQMITAVVIAEKVSIRAIVLRISSWRPAPKFFETIIANPVTSPFIMLNISETTEAVEPTAAIASFPSAFPIIIVSVRL